MKLSRRLVNKGERTMKVKDYISNCIEEIQQSINDKEFELDQLFSKTDQKQKEIYLLELKQDVYRQYLKNGRRFKENAN